VHSQYKEKNKMMRFYDDGTIEYIQLTSARLELLHVRFDAYPFDQHHFEIFIESRSHTDKRIVLEKLDDMIGIAVKYTKDWPSWRYKYHEVDVHLHPPDYVYKNPCRKEKRSEYLFHIVAEREDDFVTTTFIPCLLLVITSFVGPFLNLNALMPRIATGFISFLTLSNMMASKVAALPKVTYPVWFIIFMNTQRYYVFTALMETAAAHIIMDRFSTRTAMKLDKYAQIALPLSYVLVNGSLFYFAPQKEEAEETNVLLQRAVAANFVAFVVFGAAWSAYHYNKLMHLLRKKPIDVHKASRVHLDKNELHALTASPSSAVHHAASRSAARVHEMDA
jgi:hypothetical protein